MKTRGENKQWEWVRWDNVEYHIMGDESVSDSWDWLRASNTQISGEEWIWWRIRLNRPPLTHTLPPLSLFLSQQILTFPCLICSVTSFCRLLSLCKTQGQPQLTNQNAGSALREAASLRKQTPEVNQKWFQRMIADGAAEEGSYKFCAFPRRFTRFPGCCLHFTKIACSPLWMQIKNMAWDRFWRFRL